MEKGVNTTIDVPEEDKQRNWCIPCFSIISIVSNIRKCFSLTGERRVRRSRLIEEDFHLPIDKNIGLPKYDPETVSKFWNNIHAYRSCFRECISSLKDGAFTKSIPLLLVYLLVYYVFNLFIAEKLLRAQCVVPGTGFKKNPCVIDTLRQWKDIEKSFTKILTLFIGFFVSFSISRWLRQVELVPHLDQIIIGLDSFLWVDPTRNEDEIMARPDMTANQLKKTIVRYYFLSWTMCLSRMSTALHKIFPNELNYYDKGLLTEREFHGLCCRSGSESWTEKWTTPLLWINKLANNLSLDDSKLVKVKDLKEGLYKHLVEFRSKLQTLQNYNEYRMPRSIIRVLTMAIYVNLVLGALAGQEFTRVDALENSVGVYGGRLFRKTLDYSFIFYDFPMFALIKFLALFGWLKTATDLSCPFGSDRYGNI